MSNLNRTPLFESHTALEAQMVEFGGWEMPIQYKTGIVKEHLATRRKAGLFDVSHMGRFLIKGSDALPFLQHVLTNNAEALEVGEAQYTLIPSPTGGALDDAYLYYFEEKDYLLVVNAANRIKDWEHFQKEAENYQDLVLEDITFETAMISLQGPESREVLASVMEVGCLPAPMRNNLGIVVINGMPVKVARTGYTGEPICFELFVENSGAVGLWEQLVAAGAEPVGLGARDTLRLEAGLPLYGHELGTDIDGKEIPIYAIALARYAVSFSPKKGDFIGREILEKQFQEVQRIIKRDCTDVKILTRRVKRFALIDKGIARDGSKLYRNGEYIGYITSGTMVPYWMSSGTGLFTEFTEENGKRPIGMAMINCDLRKGDEFEIEIRNKRLKAVVVPYHMRSEAPPYSRPILYDEIFAEEKKSAEDREARRKVVSLLKKAGENTKWRQTECVNLIPSEMTTSTASRILSVMDPSNRYAEHKKVKAFKDAEVFYYQGTDFIGEVENLLKEEMKKYLGCSEVEARVISGQMANTAVFSAMVEYLNRTDRKCERCRIQKIMNNHIIRGGHLSAQPMGALKDFIARNPKTEQPAVVNFPVHEGNPYKIDVEASRKLIEEHKPQLMILGKSMIIHSEPVAEFRAIIDELGLNTILMYDMAHVLGLIGPHFQEPFREGADIVTGSTHKTFFGTQRGVIGVNFNEEDKEYPLWNIIQQRAFPGSVSNHHLGTLLGLLMSAFEMNHFRESYQSAVIKNAKAFAEALHECGINVEGDPDISYTQTHQVIVEVGYAKGPEIARRLEENNIIVNYQATPNDEGFSAARGLRLGVSEMTRFGMTESDFRELASLMSDVILKNRDVKKEVAAFRKKFTDMQFCFSGGDFDSIIQDLHSYL